MHRLSSALAVSVGLLALPPVAHASGRGVGITGFVFDPNDPDTIYARLSFYYGLVVTRDGGKSWRWICGRGTGTNQTDNPTYVMTPKGTLVGATLAGVTVSRDRGCSFSFVGGRGAYPLVHLAVRPSGELIGVSSDGSHLVISTDDARSFAAAAGPRDPTVEIERIATAPSDAARLYLSGVRDRDKLAVRGEDTKRRAAFFVSYDDARSWTERKLDAALERTGTLVLKVDPNNPDRVYVWTERPTWGTPVLVTEDAGLTWSEVLRPESWLFDVALSNDGKLLFVATADSLWVATSGVFAFTKVSSGVAAVGLSGNALWLAGGDGIVASPNGRDFDYALREPRSCSAYVFETKLRLNEIEGPLDCPAGTSVAEVCGDEWLDFRPFPLGIKVSQGATAERATLAPHPQTGANRPHVLAAFAALAGLGIAGYVLRKRLRRR